LYNGLDFFSRNHILIISGLCGNIVDEKGAFWEMEKWDLYGKNRNL